MNKNIQHIEEMIQLGEEVQQLEEKNCPTNPSKWAYYKSQAKEKFDVYPSAYANGWASKQYKAAGGGWKQCAGESVNEAQKVNPTSNKFLKGMKKIKVKGLGGYMPGVDYVYVDGDKYYFVDTDGDHMELKNTATIKQLHKLHGSSLGESINEWKLQLDLGKVNPSEFEDWASDSLQKKHKIKVSGSGKNWIIVGKGNDDRMGSSADWISQLLGKAWTINKIKVVQKESVNEAVSFKDGKYHFYSKNGIAYLTYGGKELSSGDWDGDADAYFMNHSSWKGQKAFDDGKAVIRHFKKNNIITESVNEAEEPEIISQLKNIVAKKQNQKLKDPKSGKMMRVDLYSASAVTQVYDALKQQKNKDKFVGLGLVGMVNMAFKLLKKESVNEAYVVMYTKNKGEKPSAAAYKDKDMALKFEKDLKKDGYITMITQKKVKGVDESVNDPEELKIGNYQTKYFHICPGASSLYKDIESKGVDVSMAERSAKLHDVLFFIEEHIQRPGYKADPNYLLVAKNVASEIMKLAKMMGLEKEHNYIQGHIDIIQKVVNGQSVNEGNAFTGALFKARKEGLTEFEFNGKKYPVHKLEEEEVIEEAIKMKNLYEGAFSEIDMIARESKNFMDFVKEFYKEFKDFPKDKETIKWLKSTYESITKNESINEAVPMPIVPPVFSGGSSGNKIVDIIYIVLYLLYAAAVAAPIFLVAIPDWFKEKAEQYRLNKKSTKEEIRRAAEDLATQLTTREKNYLAKLVNKMYTTKGSSSLRAQQVTNAKRYLDTLKGRHSDK